MAKERLDQALVRRGLVDSREKGKALIMAGQVSVNRQRSDKPGTKVGAEDVIEVKEKPFVYVSRGGLKLEKALQVFGLSLEGKVILDIGASTGGFTHCALLSGAKRVYAVDVGYGQLAWSLRQDERVVNMERTNARNLGPGDIPETVDMVTIDVAFISLEKILPAVIPLLEDGGSIIALVKPQFEAGREKVGKKGVVKDSKVHHAVLEKVIDFCQGNGLLVKGLDYSPIKGPEGNIEFLLLLEKGGVKEVNIKPPELIKEVIEKAHREL